MNSAGWYPVELIVIQTIIWAGLEILWRTALWKNARNIRRRVNPDAVSDT